jgi:hypothetical protein
MESHLAQRGGVGAARLSVPRLGLTGGILMPLKPGKSRGAFEANVRELTAANKGKAKPRSRAQILAIAYAEKRMKPKRTVFGEER